MWNDNTKFASLLEIPYVYKNKEQRIHIHCQSCGARVPATGICEYCGTINIKESETKPGAKLIVLPGVIYKG